MYGRYTSVLRHEFRVVFCLPWEFDKVIVSDVVRGSLFLIEPLVPTRYLHVIRNPSGTIEWGHSRRKSMISSFTSQCFRLDSNYRRVKGYPTDLWYASCSLLSFQGKFAFTYAQRYFSSFGNGHLIVLRLSDRISFRYLTHYRERRRRILLVFSLTSDESSFRTMSPIRRYHSTLRCRSSSPYWDSLRRISLLVVFHSSAHRY